MEGLHISKYAVNDASTNKWFTTSIYKQKYLWHKISSTCIDMWTLVPPSIPIHTCWSCDYVRTVRAHDSDWLQHGGCTGDVDILLHSPHSHMEAIKHHYLNIDIEQRLYLVFIGNTAMTTGKSWHGLCLWQAFVCLSVQANFSLWCK